MTSAGEPVVMVLANWRGVGGFHPYATVAAYAGDACRGVCSVDAEAEFGVAQTDKYGAERIFRAGRNGGYAVVQFFLNRFRDVPDGIERFGTDFVRTEVGLRHRFTHCDRINFCQFCRLCRGKGVAGGC